MSYLTALNLSVVVVLLSTPVNFFSVNSDIHRPKTKNMKKLRVFALQMLKFVIAMNLYFFGNLTTIILHAPFLPNV